MELGFVNILLTPFQWVSSLYKTCVKKMSLDMVYPVALNNRNYNLREQGVIA